MVRLAPKDLDGDYGLFELVAMAFQMLFGKEPEEPAHPLISQETGARKDALQLPARGLGVCTRDEHFSRIHLFSSMCKCMKHALSLSTLALGSYWAHCGLRIGSLRTIQNQEDYEKQIRSGNLWDRFGALRVRGSRSGS